MRLLLTAFLAVAAAIVPAAARETISLNFDWDFVPENGTPHTVNLPHDFLIEQPWVAPAADEGADNSDAAANVRSRLSSRAFKEMGKATYTKTITPADSLRGKRVLLDFKGIMLTGDVYLNGTLVGGTPYGYLGFEVDVTDLLKYGEPNEIKVVADTGGPLNSRWYTGGGLYRDVNMVVTDKDMYFNRHGMHITTPEIAADKAVVAIKADMNVTKPHEKFVADIKILSPQGEVVSDTRHEIEIQPKWRNREYDLAEIEIADPQLWSCETPNLYKADVTLLRADGTVADRSVTPFGIRTIEFSPDFGFKLNGEKVLLKGIANHHTLGALGAAAYPRAIEKRIQLLKDFGFNHIRTSHNPYSEEFLDLCDQYGILVVDELYDKWLKQYAGGKKEWTEQWQDDLPEWVKRDRNHPCVIMWSLGNELQGYSNLPFNDWGVTAYKLQKTLLEKYDTSRPTTVAMHPRVRSLETDSLPAPLALETDIASYNYRYMYFPGDSRRFPNMIFYQSEANLSNMGPNFYVPDNDKVVGLAYWGMIDYLGESMGWPAKGFAEGVFDISLNPKGNAYFLKAMFTDEPLVHIGVASPRDRIIDWNGVKMGGERVDDTWNLEPGDTVKIYTYTNADEVALLLNGKLIGRKKNDKTDPMHRSRIAWENVPYAPGELVAVAYTDGKEVARHKISTAGKSVKLRATPDNDSWRADGIDLQHVAVEAVDSKGRRVPGAADEVKFEIVDGDATIVAVTNGDITSEELNVQDHRRLYKGRNMVILRAGKTSGPATLRVSAPGFKPVDVKLTLN